MKSARVQITLLGLLLSSSLLAQHAPVAEKNPLAGNSFGSRGREEDLCQFLPDLPWRRRRRGPRTSPGDARVPSRRRRLAAVSNHPRWSSRNSDARIWHELRGTLAGRHLSANPDTQRERRSDSRRRLRLENKCSSAKALPALPSGQWAWRTGWAGPLDGRPVDGSGSAPGDCEPERTGRPATQCRAGKDETRDTRFAEYKRTKTASQFS